jgi:hypothetical protein
MYPHIHIYIYPCIPVYRYPHIQVYRYTVPNLVDESSELVFMWLYNEYHLQEPGKENVATPSQDNGHPELKGPAEKKKKSRVCIVPSMLWIICIPLPLARCHEK